VNPIVCGIVRAVFHLWFNFSIEGTENIPKEGGIVIASNHRSFADVVAITIPMKPPLKYMARDTLFKNKIVSLFIRILGAFPVKRDTASTELFKTCDEILRAGKNLVIFPEGTRQYKNKVGAGKAGVAMIAARSGADVLPCGIIFEGEKLHFRSKFTIKFGPIIKADEISVDGTSSKEMRKVRDRIMNAIRELVEGGVVSADSSDGVGKTDGTDSLGSTDNTGGMSSTDGKVGVGGKDNTSGDTDAI
jgi:1-acyl-sn-glycerol-3-phosphate acyltransferase